MGDLLHIILVLNIVLFHVKKKKIYFKSFFYFNFILVYSARNFTICSPDDINGSTDEAFGIVTSDNYPNYVENQSCRRKIVAPVGKFIRVFITDLSIEQSEQNGM